MISVRPTPRYRGLNTPVGSSIGYGEASRRPSAKTNTRARRGRSRVAHLAAAPVISHRVLPVCLMIGILYVGLVSRLVFIQVFRHPDYVRSARELRNKAVPLPARRGVLLDRDGAPLVQNEPACDIVIDPNLWFARPGPKGDDTPDARRQRAIDGLSAILPDVDVAGIVARRGLTKGATDRYRTIDIARQVSEGVGERVGQANLLGVGVFPTARRIAIDGHLAPHVLGFTGRDGQGLDGLEHGLDEFLSGEPGLIKAEFDKHGPIPGTVREDRPAQHGQDIVLTLDSRLQHVAQEALENAYVRTRSDAATVVVMNPKNGDILAMANYPTYDVNARSGVPPAARQNRAVSAPYEPGSTLKMVTIAGMLEENKATPSTPFFCPGYKKIGRRTIHCHDNERHGAEDLTHVLTNSCNIATADCAFQLGKASLYHYLKAFGFGEKTGSGLPGEDRGLLYRPDRWSDIQLANVAFGQGISVTPLQLATAYAAIANDGVLVRPRIVWGVRDGAGRMREASADAGRRVLSSATARTMRRMLQAVIEEGTGKPARLDSYTAGGKTGTAQIAEHGHYGGKYVCSFIGMAPANDPRLVILAAVTNPKGEHFGGRIAGPVFKEIAEKALVDQRVPRDAAPLSQRKMVRTAARD
jgi:stage V sporulation protein D (sporulation-specific penicillin-binding protein)